MNRMNCPVVFTFLSTPSARRATRAVSWPASLMLVFLSTPSARRATVFSNRLLTAIIISIHALREEGDTPAMSSSIVEINISIHALREEGDDRRRGCSRVAQHFYPRPPRGGRQGAETPLPQRVGFLSTPSARRATVCRADSGCSAQYFYPRPPRGGRRLKGQGSKTLAGYFYPRPPRGGRRSCWPSGVGALLFLSTPSARRATAPTPHRARGRSISIHALREEGDYVFPCSIGKTFVFLSTPSARRATFISNKFSIIVNISIHALREEGDRCPFWSPLWWRHFYPRPPRGGRRVIVESTPTPLHFYPRPPRGGRLLMPSILRSMLAFLSTPSARRATYRYPGDRHRKENFYPRPPRGGRPKSDRY